MKHVKHGAESNVDRFSIGETLKCVNGGSISTINKDNEKQKQFKCSSMSVYVCLFKMGGLWI